MSSIIDYIKNIFGTEKNEKLSSKEQFEKLERDLEEAKGHESSSEEKNILKGLVQFGTTTAKQIMKSRVDLMGIDIDIDYYELQAFISKWGFSRFPVYRDNIDRIEGILYVKDLFPFFNKDKNFEWQKLIRPCDFIPESKKIDELLHEFKLKRLHMGVVVDEYGGTAGILTLEDILEEIVGEINDEFDDVEQGYAKIDNNTWSFEAKILLNDFCKALDIDSAIFDEVKGESESLGGMLLEINSDMPLLGDKISFNDFEFEIEAADDKRIKRVKVRMHQHEENNGEESE